MQSGHYYKLRIKYYNELKLVNMSFLNVDKQNSTQTPTVCNLDTTKHSTLRSCKTLHTNFKPILYIHYMFLYYVYDIQYIIHKCEWQRIIKQYQLFSEFSISLPFFILALSQEKYHLLLSLGMSPK